MKELISIALVFIALLSAFAAGGLWLTTQSSKSVVMTVPPLILKVIHDLAKAVENIQFRLEEMKRLSITDEGRWLQVRDRIDDDAAFLADNIHDIQLYLLNGEQNIPIHSERIDLGELCKQVRDTMMVRARKHNVRLIVESPSVLPTISADRSQMEQVLRNLIDNAIKFSDEKDPKVVVTLRADANFLILEVSDNGRGIAPERLDHIWEMFARPRDASSIHIEGTGLGLAIVKQVVDQHRGTVTVSSKPGSTIFTIKLPTKLLA